MSQPDSATPKSPTWAQQFAWHASNAAPVLGIMWVMNAKSAVSAIAGVVLAVAGGYAGHRWKKRGVQAAGAERVRIGQLNPVPPDDRKGWYVAGTLFFAALTVSMLLIEDFRPLMRIAMAIVMGGLTLTFVSLIKPAFRKPVVAVLGLTMLTGGILIVWDAALVYREGADNAVLQAVKTGLFGSVLLICGLVMVCGMLFGRRDLPTPLFENGIHTQWGFMPWSMLSVQLLEERETPQFEATSFNGWKLRADVPPEHIDEVRRIVDEAHQPNSMAADQLVS